MNKLSLFFVFIIVSCGGGSSSSIDGSITSDSNDTSNDLIENCIQQQINLIRCDFIHQGLDRYYLIQPPHPEAVGDSSLLFNLHGYGSNAMEQMVYSGLNSNIYKRK